MAGLIFSILMLLVIVALAIVALTLKLLDWWDGKMAGKLKDVIEDQYISERSKEIIKWEIDRIYLQSWRGR